MAMRTRICLLLGFVLTGPVQGQCVSKAPWVYYTVEAQHIFLTGNTSAAFLSGGAAYWNNCPQMGTRIPSFFIGSGLPSVGPTVTVLYHVGVDSGTGRCGNYSPMPSGDATIEIWSYAFGIRIPCPDPVWILGHELGHALGLSNAVCSGYIMGSDPGVWPAYEECAVADSNWTTPLEVGICLDFGDECMDGQSPIIIDLDGNGFRLTGASDPVQFDIDADGKQDTLSWTAAGELDAFLALDRNDNGVIDDGGELFGNATRLSDGARVAHGYIALAEFDLVPAGGNGNGAIDKGDAWFGEFLVWFDLNHNGKSEPHELWSLEEVGLTKISLGYVENRRQDRHGNAFRFNSHAWIGVHDVAQRRISTSDVFFVGVP